jgi:hypothetical protein
VSERKKPLQSAAALRNFKDKKPHRARLLILLTLVAAAGIALFFAIRPQAVPETDESASTSVALIARDKTLLHSITVAVTGAAPYTLINENDYDLSDENDTLGKEYSVQGDPDFAVSTAQVLPMERYASDLSADDVAVRAPEDLAQYGLKQPAMTVTIGYRDNTKETLYFGDAVPTGNGCYLQRAGDQTVYIAADSVYEAFHRALEDLKQTEQEKADLAAAEAAEASAAPSPAPTGATANTEATQQPGAATIPEATLAPTPARAAPTFIATPASITSTTSNP